MVWIRLGFACMRLEIHTIVATVRALASTR
jgi:hypothetical protein